MKLTKEQLENNLKSIEMFRDLLPDWIGAWNSDGYNLDYSEESLKDIDDILLSKYEIYKSGEFDFCNTILLIYGLYIIKVIENNYECGVMSVDVVDGDLKYKWRNIEMFPYSWCINRVKNGETDSVFLKYQVSTQILSKIEIECS